jgi:hypothetical protein
MKAGLIVRRRGWRLILMRSAFVPLAERHDPHLSVMTARRDGIDHRQRHTLPHLPDASGDSPPAARTHRRLHQVQALPQPVAADFDVIVHCFVRPDHIAPRRLERIEAQRAR